MRISDWISDVSSDLDLLGHGKARVAQMLREDARGADLLHPEFGVLVEVLVERVERRIVFVEQCGQPRLSGGKIGCRLRAGRGEGEGQRSRRSEEHTSELQSLMRISYAVFCLKKKKRKNKNDSTIREANLMRSA